MTDTSLMQVLCKELDRLYPDSTVPAHVAADEILRAILYTDRLIVNGRVNKIDTWTYAPEGADRTYRVTVEGIAW